MLSLWLLASAATHAEVVRLEGHGGPVMAVATVGPDRALTASFDNSVGFWSLATGEPRWLEGHGAAVKAVIALPGDRAASAGDDFAIIVWNLADGSIVHRLEGHNGSIAALAVSADGSLLASAGWDGRIGLWELGDGANVAWLSGHNGAVNDVVFVGEALYSASADGTIRVWDTAARTETRVLLRHGFAINCLLADPAAGWLAYGAVDGGTRVLSLDGDHELADLSLGRRPILALAAHGDNLAVGDGEGQIMVVGTDDWTIRHDFRAAEKGPVWALAFTPDGTRLIAGGIDNAAFILPVEGPAEPTMATASRSFQRDPATMDNGERQFQRKCSVCHTLTGDGERRAGPTLAGIIGRPAGVIAGFAYSDTLKDSDIVWSDDTLSALFDLGPEHYIPGSKMPMQRIVKADDRRDLIEFLRNSTSEQNP